MLQAVAILTVLDLRRAFDEPAVMQTEPILIETIACIQEILGADLDRITVERVAIGLFFTGVKLDTGVTGACATPLRSIPDAVCCPSSAMAMPFPGKLRGRFAKDLLKETAAPSGIRRAVGVAAMNALADMCWERRATRGWIFARVSTRTTPPKSNLAKMWLLSAHLSRF